MKSRTAWLGRSFSGGCEIAELYVKRETKLRFRIGHHACHMAISIDRSSRRHRR